ncbi:MAG: hypothetical protein ACRD0C_15270 [Acidimicrobiia bacterium]
MSEDDDRRRQIMERLAEMLQGPPPDRSGAGPGDMEEALAELPEEAAALFRAMLEGFQSWQRQPRGEGDRENGPAGDDS